MHKIFRKKIRSSTVDAVEYNHDNALGSWIQITAATDEDIQIIKQETGLSTDEIRMMLDEFERPRIEKNRDTVIIIFHFPVTTEGNLETIPLVIIVTPRNIITVCRCDAPIFDEFTSGTASNFNTTMKSRFILMLFHKISHHFERNLRMIDRILDDFEKNLSRYTDNKEVNKIFNIKKALIYFHTAVIGNNNVLRKITSGSFVPLYAGDKDLLDDIIIDNDQTVELVSIYNNILTSSLDSYASVVSNNLNVVMKFLTIVTITLAVPTLVASLWGMNVPVPMHDHPMAFPSIVAVSIVLSFVVSYFFLRKR